MKHYDCQYIKKRFHILHFCAPSPNFPRPYEAFSAKSACEHPHAFQYYPRATKYLNSFMNHLVRLDIDFLICLGRLVRISREGILLSKHILATF